MRVKLFSSKMHHFLNWNRAFYAGFPKYCGRGLQEDFPMFTSPSQIPTYRVHSQTFTNYFFQLTLRTQSIIFFHAAFSSRTFAQSHPLHFFLSKCLRCYVTNLKWVIALSFLSQNLLDHRKLSPNLSHIFSAMSWSALRHQLYCWPWWFFFVHVRETEREAEAWGRWWA